MKQFNVEVVEPFVGKGVGDWKKVGETSRSEEIVIKTTRKRKRTQPVLSQHEKKWTTAQFNVYLFGAGMR